MNCKIFYRISSENHKTPRLPGTTKIRCLDNFISAFGKDMNVLADNCDDELLEQIKNRELSVIATNLGNSKSFLYALSQATHYPNDTLVYFVEDDYLHLPTAPKLLQECSEIETANYITLYDHPDKYGPLYGPGECTYVFRTASSHWRWTISTCMTFAAKVKTLKDHMDVWNSYCQKDAPADHEAFCHLHGHGLGLAVCIPGAAVHTDLTHSMVEGRNLMEPWAIQMMITKVEQGIYKSWDADAIETMEAIMHHEKHPPLELLTLISEIEIFSKRKRANKR